MNITTKRFRIVVKWYPDPSDAAVQRRDALLDCWRSVCLLVVFLTGYLVAR